MNSHAIDWANLKINVLMDGNEISRLGKSNISFHNANGGKVQQMSDPFLIKHQNVLLPHIKQNNLERVVKAVNSFSLQVAVAGVSVDEILFALKETSNEKAIWNKE